MSLNEEISPQSDCVHTFRSVIISPSAGLFVISANHEQIKAQLLFKGGGGDKRRVLKRGGEVCMDIAVYTGSQQAGVNLSLVEAGLEGGGV